MVSRKEIVSLLKELTEAPGAPGLEGAVRAIFRRELGGEFKWDNLGSIIREHAGSSNSPRVMLAAHLDEVAFIVQSITEKGFIRFAPLGGWWSHVLPAKRVKIYTRKGKAVTGVIGAKPPHFLSPEERNKLLKVEQMFIDVGASSEEEVRNSLGIREGDAIILYSEFEQLGEKGEFLLGKAFDDRVGVALAILASRQLYSLGHPNTLVTAGTVQEEVGTRGAQTASYVAEPDFALILEGTPADDLPGSTGDPSQAVLGRGVQLRMMDPSAIAHRPFVEKILEVAEREEIPLQLAVRRSGGTDARVVHLNRKGVPTAVLGVPVRYAHTPNSIVHIDDVESALKLIVAVVRELTPEVASELTDFSKM